MWWLAAFAWLAAAPGCGDTNKPDVQATAASSAKAASSPESSNLPASSPAAPSAPAPVANGNSMIDVSYIGPDYCAALVINPRRIMQLPVVARQMKDESVTAAVKKLGFDPAEVEQLLILAPLPEKAAAARPKPGESSDYAPMVIAHFTHAVDTQAILTKMREGSSGPAFVEKQLDGKTYYASGPNEIAYSPNPKTVILTTEHYIKKIIGDVMGDKMKVDKGSLIERLRTADADNDVIGVAALDNFPDLDKLIEQAKQGQSVLVKNYLDAVKTLHGGTVTMNLNGSSLLHISLEAKMADAAGDIGNMFEQGMQMLGGLMAMMKTQIPPQQQKSMAPALKLGDELIAAAATKANGAQVDFIIKRPASMDTALPQLADMAKQSVLEAQASAQHAKRSNNLHEVAIAMQNYASTYNSRFPAASWTLFSFSKEKPKLSWRVALLPYFGETALYKQFNFNEPWDSPHNRELINKMPDVYCSPGRANDGKTTIMVFSGKDTPFDGDKGITLADIKDGMSNTIMAVEAGPDKAVIWTKPEDLPFDQDKPLAALGQIPAEGFLAAMFDGSVRRLKVDNAALKAMITPAGGEVVP
jgi:hypothetical protein